MRWSSGRLEVAGGGITRRSVRTIWGLALGTLALVGACASGGGPKKTPDPSTAGAVDLNGEGRTSSDKTTVVVDNQNLNEMTIYAYQGTQRMRLGRAKSQGLTELKIPSSIVNGVVQIRFLAEPMVTGGQRAYLSEMIPVQPGDQVDFLIPYTR
jgi:ABC-type antimicrobial peptide transport system permease subunit